MAISNIAAKRIKNDLRDVAENDCGITVEVQNDNLQKLKGKISGPPGTPYEGGEFILDIEIPPGYPFKPIKAKFVTKVWHPNIGPKTGEICLDILKSTWTATMTLRTVLLSIQSLMQDPAADEPLNATAAWQCKNNSEMYEHTARYWAHAFAGAPRASDDFDGKVKKLINKGANEETAITILTSNSWNLEKALNTIHRRSQLFKSVT